MVKIILILWVVAILGFICTLILPPARKNGIPLVLAVVVCILNAVIQAVS